MYTHGFCFDDVLLIPKYSEIKSRDDVDLSVELPKGIKLQIPFVSANMKNVTGVTMAQAFKKLGGLAILHRFDEPDQIISNFIACTDSSGAGIIGASIGIKEKDFYLAEKLYNLGCKVLCLDVAHGHHKDVQIFLNRIRKQYEDVCLIAGNVVTEEGALSLWRSGADIIKIGIGSGCFAAGTRILMANGTYKNIEDVKAGDRIINKDGLPRSVLNSFSTGIRKVSKLRNSIFYKDTYVTHNHKYFVGDLDSVSNDTLESQGYAKILSKPKKNGDSKFGWQEIGAKMAKCLLMPRNIKFELSNSFCHDICIRNGGNGHSSIKTKVDFSLEPSYNLGYIFGTFLGDGHAMTINNGQTNIGAVYWYFGLEENHIAEKLRRSIKSITNRDIKINKKSNIIECILYHKPLAEFLSTFGKKKDKHLPEKFIVNNQSYLQGISEGLIDSDGHIEEGERVCLTNTSHQIIELFNVITYLLSEVFPNNQKGEISTGNLKGANVENFNTLVDAFQASKLLEYIETDEEVEVFDLTIDCETHSFIANNAIVHNSICSTRIETGNGYPQLSALKNVCEGDYKPWGTSNDFTDKGPMFIADGGIRSAGDCVKSLCFADLVMIGNLFAGTDEAPGQVISMNGQKFKEYAGSSTHKKKYIEGVVGLVPYKGSVVNVVKNLVEGIRSGCSYQGVDQVRKLQLKPEFVVISNAGLRESHPHDIKL